MRFQHQIDGGTAQQCRLGSDRKRGTCQFQCAGTSGSRLIAQRRLEHQVGKARTVTATNVAAKAFSERLAGGGGFAAHSQQEPVVIPGPCIHWRERQRLFVDQSRSGQVASMAKRQREIARAGWIRRRQGRDRIEEPEACGDVCIPHQSIGDFDAARFFSPKHRIDNSRQSRHREFGGTNECAGTLQCQQGTQARFDGSERQRLPQFRFVAPAQAEFVLPCGPCTSRRHGQAIVAQATWFRVQERLHGKSRRLAVLETFGHCCIESSGLSHRRREQRERQERRNGRASHPSHRAASGTASAQRIAASSTRRVAPATLRNRAFHPLALHDRRVRKSRVAILGSTGSIGTQALDICREHDDRFEVVALQANSSAEALADQAARYSVLDACLTRAANPPESLPAATRFHSGPEGLIDMLERSEPDVVLNGITGAAGLPASEWTLRHGRRLALANKESMVLAGSLLMDLALRYGGEILPVDSEHCAIHQCLRSGRRSEVRKIHLTGSGGPFRNRHLETFDSITPKEALNHPTWTMGPRITVGSATMMNKAFEVLEARWLFDLEPEQIQVVIHPQSIVHSMVEFRDGSVVAQCGLPDMRLPILYCLAYPDRLEHPFQPFDATKWSKLEFLPADTSRYPAINLAYEVMRLGGDSGAVLNAADEVLTQRFLDGVLPFPSITGHATTIVRKREVRPIRSIADVIAADREGRELAERLVPPR